LRHAECAASRELKGRPAKQARHRPKARRE
jgi:hypothetical protein